MPFTGAQRTGQITQTIVLATVAHHPGHSRRTARRALGQATGGLEFRRRQRQQPTGPGCLQRSPRNGTSAAGTASYWPASKAMPQPLRWWSSLPRSCNASPNGPVVAPLKCSSRACNQSKPRPFTHQAVGRQRRQTMAYAQALALLGHRHARLGGYPQAAAGCGITVQSTTGSRQGHCLRPVAQGVRRAAQTDWRGGRCRNGGATADASICPGSSIVLKRLSFFSSVIARCLVTGDFAGTTMHGACAP